MTTTATASTTNAPKVRRAISRTRVIGAVITVIGLFTIYAFAMGSASNAHSALTFNPVDLSSHAPWRVGTLTLLTRATNLVLGGLMVALGLEVALRQPRRGVMVRFGVVAVLFFFALMLWAVRAPGPSQVSFLNLTSVLIGSSTVAMVLVFGSLSGVMCERAGVVNIAIEGQFIGGAFVGVMIASTTHNFIYAALGGAAVGALVGLILAFLSLRYLSDQIIVGVVLVTMLASFSSYFNLQVFTPYPQFNAGTLAPNIAIPLLSKIPLLGPVFFNQTGFFYAMIIIVAAVSFALFKTRYGLRVRAVGEHPKAAASVGINVIRTRYINVVIGGAIAGLGGVALIAGQGQFQPGITSGYGYIALAALIFGRWRPSGAVVASVLFGVSLYVSYILKAYQVPVSIYVLNMFPYIITIAVVSGLIGRVRSPAADGLPYSHD